MRKLDTRTDYLSKLGYESRDVAVSTLVRWFVILVVIVSVVAGITYGLYFIFVPETAQQAVTSNLATSRKIPPDPRIQARPKTDIRTFRAWEDSKLERYGYVDQQKGVVQIPVDRAIQIIAQRGLPKTGEAPPTTPRAPAVEPGTEVIPPPPGAPAGNPANPPGATGGVPGANLPGTSSPAPGTDVRNPLGAAVPNNAPPNR